MRQVKVENYLGITGIEQISDSSRHYIFRILWSIFVFACACFTIYQVLTRISFYLQEPVTVFLQIEQHQSLALPQFTFCFRHNQTVGEIEIENSLLRNLKMQTITQDYLGYTCKLFKNDEVKVKMNSTYFQNEQTFTPGLQGGLEIGMWKVAAPFSEMQFTNCTKKDIIAYFLLDEKPSITILKRGKAMPIKCQAGSKLVMKNFQFAS